MIQRVGKSSLEPQAKTLRKGKLLGQTGVYVDLSGALQYSYATSAEASGVGGGKSESVLIIVILRRPIGSNDVPNAIGTRHGPSEIPQGTQTGVRLIGDRIHRRREPLARL